MELVENHENTKERILIKTLGFLWDLSFENESDKSNCVSFFKILQQNFPKKKMKEDPEAPFIGRNINEYLIGFPNKIKIGDNNERNFPDEAFKKLKYFESFL